MTMLKFTDVYGVPFGTRANLTKYPDRTTSDFEVLFTTPNHDESDVRFTLPLMAYVMNKNMILQILDAETREVLYTHNRSFSMFINDSGIDPKAGAASGHPHIGSMAARPYWLKKNHSYILRVIRPQGHSDRMPIGIIYQSLDKDPEGILREGEGEENIVVINGKSYLLIPMGGGE